MISIKTKKAQTDWNGQPSKPQLFNSKNNSMVSLHFKRMQQYVIDLAALKVSKIQLFSLTDKMGHIFDYSIAFRFTYQDKSSFRSAIERYSDKVKNSAEINFSSCMTYLDGIRY